jgi:hypothetical protein
VLSGLTNSGTTEDDIVQCAVDTGSKKLTITKFGFFPASSFSLTVEATNPGTHGTTSAFSVTTYQDAGATKVIDQHTTATMTIDNIAKPDELDLAWTTDNQIPQAGNTFKPVFSFKPFADRTATTMVVKIRFPEGTTFDGSPTT